MERDFDAIIVGSGIVGASLALILAKLPLKIALVEASYSAGNTKKSSSEKTIVIAHTSRMVFESMGIWEALSKSASPIREIHVSDRGNFGTTRISAEEEKLPALGYVLPADDIDFILHSSLQRFKNITLLQPAKFKSYKYESNIASVEIEQEGQKICLTGKLLVGADGHNSAIRNFLNISVITKDYDQTAIICNVNLKRSHFEIAYERFTPQGPLAMLPLLDNRCAVVWTVKKSTANHLLTLSNDQFINQLQKSFGYRVGKILHSSQPLGIDLSLTTATNQIGPGMVLLGNAVHTLHPVAGQGLNLALRDLAVLAEEIYFSMQQKQILGAAEMLQRYSSRRQKDQREIVTLTHALVGVFSNSLLPLIFARDVGLVLLDRITWLKKILTKRTLGMAGKVPRLACGMTLE